MSETNFFAQIQEGIPKQIPEKKAYDLNINHAPKRKDIIFDLKQIDYCLYIIKRE